MSSIEELLDLLVEYQAQKDLLDMDKQRLIDEVKIPAEVLAAQDEANKRRQKFEVDTQIAIQEIQKTVKTLLAEVVDPEMPPEFMEALAKARAEREDIQSQASSRYEALQAQLTAQRKKIDDDLQSKVADVYRQVEWRKAEIIAEFGDKAAAVVDNIAKLTAEIKEAVIAEGKSVKGKCFQAVYVAGRVTWKTDVLDKMIADVPALAAARKEGEPSVTIRRIA